MTLEPLDCAVIGGGPAGLTAAIYLARFHLKVLVVDAGDSRAALIPKTRNHAGFPDGISGTELLSRMRDQACRYGVRFLHDTVREISKSRALFHINTTVGSLAARSVLLATGVVNNRPDMPAEMHEDALSRGLLRYCPICDGFEVTDKRIGVVGSGERGVREAIFLRSYSSDVKLVAPDDRHALDADQRATLAEARIELVDGPARFEVGEDEIVVLAGPRRLAFDSVYPALGSVIRSELAVVLGAEASGDGCLAVDNHQRTTTAGLYAAGDVVIGLDQISHAMGEGGVAATTIRNDLANERRLYR
jgi:thioredoxin reductase (NADPH)